MGLPTDTLNVTPDQAEKLLSAIRGADWQTVIKSVAVLVVGLIAVRLLMRLVGRALKKSRLPDSLHAVLRTVLRIVLDLVVILTAASSLGIPVTSFVTLVGLAGLTVSLALKGIVENFAGSLILIGSKPFEVGDVVEADSVVGIVREIRIMSTVLESFDGKTVYIPNSKLYTTRITNFTRTGRRRVELSVSASYDNSPAQVRAAALRAVERTENILPDPAPTVMTASYDASDIRYDLWVWTDSDHFLQVKTELLENIYAAFAESGVQMSYPHLNVHMKEPGA